MSKKSQKVGEFDFHRQACANISVRLYYLIGKDTIRYFSTTYGKNGVSNFPQLY